MAITVEVLAGASSGERDQSSVEGGEGPSGEPPPSISLSTPFIVSSIPTAFGMQHLEVRPENEGGEVDTQAGDHPFQFTTAFRLNEVLEFNPRVGSVRSVPALLKDANVQLPPGLIGNPQATDQCSSLAFGTVGSNNVNLCPRSTVIGAATVTLNEPNQAGVVTRAVPVFNLIPARGEPARFGFFVLKDLVILDTSVRTGSDYGVTVSVNNASQVAKVLSSQVTIWGVPGDPRHDASRGWECVGAGENVPEAEVRTSCPENNPAPFLTLPTLCTSGLSTTALVDSWPEPGPRLPNGEPDTSDPRWKSANYSLPLRRGWRSFPSNRQSAWRRHASGQHPRRA